MGENKQEQEALIKILEKVLNEKGRVIIRIRSFWLPIIWGIIGALGGSMFTWYVGVFAIRSDLQENGRSHAYFTNAIVKLENGMWSAQQMRVYADRTLNSNATHKIPNVDEIRQFYPYVGP